MARRSRKALETLTTSPSVREAAAALINAVREESLSRMVTSEAYTRAVERVGRVRGRPLQLPLLSGGVGNGARVHSGRGEYHLLQRASGEQDRRENPGGQARPGADI